MVSADRKIMDDAVGLARAAGELTLHWFTSKTIPVKPKADGTPVTPADKTAEHYIRRELAALYPGDAVIGEEDGLQPGSSGRTWIIDPIDGTKAFIHGVPLFSNLIACYDEHGPAIGVVNLPALGQTLWAGRGLGCHLDGEEVHVNHNADLSRGWICTSGFEDWPGDALTRITAAGPTLRTWGDAYGFVLVATGMIDAMVDPVVSLWDIAPMPVVITEAGGRFTDVTGNGDVPLDPSRDFSAVATNATIHDELLDLVRSRPSGSGSPQDRT